MSNEKKVFGRKHRGYEFVGGDESLLTGEDDCQDISTNLNSKGENTHLLKWLFCYLLLALLCILGFLNLQRLDRISSRMSDANTADTAIKYHCGNSSAEARKLGCTFDVSASYWVPQQCQWPELIQKYKDRGPFRFYKTIEGIGEYTEEELAELDAGAHFYTTQGEHLAHCGVQLEKVHLAWMTGHRLDPITRNINHTRHCGEIIVWKYPFDMINIENTITFGEC